MAALHEHGRKLIRAVFAVDSNRVACRRRKHLDDSLIHFLDQIQLLHMAFAQLSIAHDLRDDPVRVLDLLLDNPDLRGRDRLALFKRPLQRERGIVDNGEGVLDPMRKLGRHAPRGA